LWLDATRAAAIGWAAVPLPIAARWLGAALLALGLALGVWALWHLGPNVTPTAVARPAAKLVTSGPYRWVRHPLYASGLLMLPGSTLLTANVLVLAGGLAGLVALLVRVRREETELVRVFGPAYVEYMARAGRIVPWIGQRRWTRPPRLAKPRRLRYPCSFYHPTGHPHHGGEHHAPPLRCRISGRRTRAARARGRGTGPG